MGSGGPLAEPVLAMFVRLSPAGVGKQQTKVRDGVYHGMAFKSCGPDLDGGRTAGQMADALAAFMTGEGPLDAAGAE